MSFWKNLNSTLHIEPLILMVVLESKGSSPGRKGFKMYVSESGNMYGSIGGGIMEHKLVEFAKNLFLKGSFKPFVKKQIHSKEAAKNQSGMICSGEQTIAFYYLNKGAVLGTENFIEYNNNGVFKSEEIEEEFKLQSLTENDWKFIENTNYKPKVYVLGGGHCSVALSKILKFLGFYVLVIDNREDLNTLEKNNYADEKLVCNYSELSKLIKTSSEDYIVLMTFGYRTDEICLKQLINKSWKYLGMLGSKAKVDELLLSMKNEGYSQEELNKVYTPIGLSINSKTPEEIAVSIAAEIIKVKNS